MQLAAVQFVVRCTRRRGQDVPTSAVKLRLLRELSAVQLVVRRRRWSCNCARGLELASISWCKPRTQAATMQLI